MYSKTRFIVKAVPGPCTTVILCSLTANCYMNFARQFNSFVFLHEPWDAWLSILVDSDYN